MGAREDNEQALYEAYAQQDRVRDDLHFLIRAGRPQALIPAIDPALAQFDPTAAVETKPMSKALTFAVAEPLRRDRARLDGTARTGPS